MFSKNPDGRIVPVDVNNMPFTEDLSDIPKTDQPTLKKFRTGTDFRLAVYNISINDDTPLVAFNIEKTSNRNDILIKGSDTIIDPSKFGLTKPAIAIIPLLHIFNEQIKTEAKRAVDLIERASGGQVVSSLSDERDKRMMRDALMATDNVMQALYRDKQPKTTEQPIVGKSCLTEGLNRTLDASGQFYDSLMDRTQKMFEPSIRTLAESVALGRLNVS